MQIIKYVYQIRLSEKLSILGSVATAGADAAVATATSAVVCYCAFIVASIYFGNTIR